MKTKIKIKKSVFLYYFSLKREIAVNTLLIILIGVFLLPQFAYSSEINKAAIIKLTNQERLGLSLNQLTENERLDKAALDKANYIMASQQFQHNINGIKFSDWIKKQDYQYSYVGENLALDFISSEGVIDAWKKSPLHYKNLINPDFKETGVAILNGRFENENTTLVVQIFGTPADLAQVLPEKIIVPNSVPTIVQQNNLINKFSPSLLKTASQPEDKLIILTTGNLPKNDLVLDIDINKLIDQNNYTVSRHGNIIKLNSYFINNLYFILMIIIILLCLYYSFTIRKLIDFQKYV